MGTKNGPSAQVAANLAAVRRRRGLTVRALSERLQALGSPLLASGITKVEQGQRSVSVDDLVALAVALNVSPVRLLLPDAYDDTEVDVTGETTVDSRAAWRWAEGRAALGAALEARTPEERFEHTSQYWQERPAGLRAIENHDAYRQVRLLLLSTEHAVMADLGLEADHDPGFTRYKMRVDLELARAEVARLLDRLGDDDGER